jgi:excisionase family DNA binding protein
MKNLSISMSSNELENLIEKVVERVFLSKMLKIPLHNESLNDVVFLKETCEITGLVESTIYSLVCKRKIPFTKPSGTKKLQFSRFALKEWMMHDRTVLIKPD